MTTDPSSTSSLDARDDSDVGGLPPAPRAITPRGRRRSWDERTVRIWMILTLIVLGTTTYFAIRDISAGLRERRLIFHGKKVMANIETVDESRNREFPLDQPRRLRLNYMTDAGRPILLNLTTPGRQPGRIKAGGTIELRTNPNDPEDVTLETEPRGWLASLAVLCLLAPLSILLLIITLLQRRQVLKVWQTGAPTIGIVVDTHRAAIAPASDIVRFTIEDHEDRRVFSTLYPHNMGALQAGDELALVMPKNSPGKAIVAELYS